MNEFKQCTQCSGEMEEGRIGAWGDKDSTWHSVKSIAGKLTGHGQEVQAWKCQRCGKLELSAK